MVFVANDTFELQSKNQDLGKLIAAFMSSTASQILKDFSDTLVAILTSVISRYFLMD